MDVSVTPDKASNMTIHKDINVAHPVTGVDWLQCDLLLCSVCVQAHQSDDLVLPTNNIILAPQQLLPHNRSLNLMEHEYCYQVKTQQGLETVFCNIHTEAECHPPSDKSCSVLDDCLSLLLQQLHISYLCYHGCLQDAAATVVTESSVPAHSAAETTQRLLAFSQQLSENILNEAVQLSTSQVPGGEQDGCDTCSVGTPCLGLSSQSAHSMTSASFVSIPVEIEFGEQQASCLHMSHHPILKSISPFKKIVLVEEVDQLDEQPKATFQPHHVQQECILEEMQRELSSSGNSASTPLDEANGDCLQSFTDRLVSGILDISVMNVTHNGLAVADDCVSGNGGIGTMESLDGINTRGNGILSGHNGPKCHDHVSEVAGADCSMGDRQNGISGNNNGVESLNDVVSDTNTSETCQQNHNASDTDQVKLEVLHDNLEALVDSMIREAFMAGFAELDMILNNNSPNLCAPEEMEAIGRYADDIVTDAFSSAMYKIREYSNQRACCQHCKDAANKMVTYMTDKALDREWNAQLIAFVDDFVLNVMEEALFIKKTQNLDFHSRLDSREKRHMPAVTPTAKNTVNTPTDGTADKAFQFAADPDMQYFEAEFSVDFHNSSEAQKLGSNTSLSRQHLRTAYSAGSSQRGSCDDDSGHSVCRRSSAGFRDVVLSEFEDELIHSDISTPSLGMFDDEELKVQRRASEPLGFNCILSQAKDKKRAQSVDGGASRRVILEWLVNRGSTNTASSSGTTNRKCTSSSHLDWFAQDLLVEAFNDAFVMLFGPNYEGLEGKPSVCSLEDFAEVLSNNILHESIEQVAACRWNVRYSILSDCHLMNEGCASMSDSQDEYMDALDVPLSELEAIAQDFSTKILEEALDIIRNEITSNERKINRIMTQDMQLNAFIQWAAATRAGAKHITFDTMALPELQKLPLVVSCLRQHNYSIADLMHLILTYVEERLDDSVAESLYVYILKQLHTTWRE